MTTWFWVLLGFFHTLIPHILSVNQSKLHPESNRFFHLHVCLLVHNNNAFCQVIAITSWLAFNLCNLWKSGSYCIILLLRILALTVHAVWPFISCHLAFYFSPPPPCSLCSGLTVFPCYSLDTQVLNMFPLLSFALTLSESGILLSRISAWHASSPSSWSYLNTAWR